MQFNFDIIERMTQKSVKNKLRDHHELKYIIKPSGLMN